MRRLDIAAEHIDRDGVADLQPEPLAEARRRRRRAADPCSRAPTSSPLRDGRALRKRVGVSRGRGRRESTQRLSGAASTFSTGTPLMARCGRAAWARRRAWRRARRLSPCRWKACKILRVDVEEVIGRGLDLDVARRTRAMSERSISAMATSKPEPEPERRRRLERASEPGPAMLGERKRRETGLGAAESCRERLQQPAEAEQQGRTASDDAGGDRGGDGALLRGRDGEREQRKAAAAAVTMKASGGRSLLVGEMRSASALRGVTTLRRGPSGQSTKQQHGEEAGDGRGQQRQLDAARRRARWAGRRHKVADSEAGVSAPSTSPMDDADAASISAWMRVDGEHEPARSAQTS